METFSYLSNSTMGGNITMSEVDKGMVNQTLDLPPSLRYSLLSILIILLVVGLLGNVLTLLALPYVRRKYGAQFSVLQSSTAILLIHLSFCDLLYITVGFTHFIHVLIIGKGCLLWTFDILLYSDGHPFLLLGAPYSHGLCYSVALVRNWAAEADFATMGKSHWGQRVFLLLFYRCHSPVCVQA